MKVCMSHFMSRLPVFFLVLVSFGCGFQPLHRAIPPEKLQSVNVQTIPDREGQILRNVLLKSLPPPKKTEYTLKVSLQQKVRQLFFRRDRTARRKEILFKVCFSLVDLAGDIQLEDEFEMATSYILPPSAEFGSFSGLMSEDDARKNALHSIGQTIIMRLSTYFTKRTSRSKV